MHLGHRRKDQSNMVALSIEPRPTDMGAELLPLSYSSKLVNSHGSSMKCIFGMGGKITLICHHWLIFKNWGLPGKWKHLLLVPGPLIFCHHIDTTMPTTGNPWVLVSVIDRPWSIVSCIESQHLYRDTYRIVRQCIVAPLTVLIQSLEECITK